MRWKKSKKGSQKRRPLSSSPSSTWSGPSAKKMLRKRGKNSCARWSCPEAEGSGSNQWTRDKDIFHFHTHSLHHIRIRKCYANSLCSVSILLSFISSSPQLSASLESSFSVQNYHSITVNFCQRLKLLPMNRAAATQLHRRMNFAFTVKYFRSFFLHNPHNLNFIFFVHSSILLERNTFAFEDEKSVVRDWNEEKDHQQVFNCYRFFLNVTKFQQFSTLARRYRAITWDNDWERNGSLILSPYMTFQHICACSWDSYHTEMEHKNSIGYFLGILMTSKTHDTDCINRKTSCHKNTHNFW